jgi:hypothetical protein
MYLVWLQWVPSMTHWHKCTLKSLACKYQDKEPLFIIDYCKFTWAVPKCSHYLNLLRALMTAQAWRRTAKLQLRLLIHNSYHKQVLLGSENRNGIWWGHFSLMTLSLICFNLLRVSDFVPRMTDKCTKQIRRREFTTNALLGFRHSVERITSAPWRLVSTWYTSILHS